MSIERKRINKTAELVTRGRCHTLTIRREDDGNALITFERDELTTFDGSRAKEPTGSEPRVRKYSDFLGGFGHTIDGVLYTPEGVEQYLRWISDQVLLSAIVTGAMGLAHALDKIDLNKRDRETHIMRSDARHDKLEANQDKGVEVDQQILIKLTSVDAKLDLLLELDRVPK
jgi:hypothetical protein